MVIKEFENQEKEDEEKIKSEFFKICGFLIYYEKTSVDPNITNEKKDEPIEKKENNSINIHNIENKSDENINNDANINNNMENVNCLNPKPEDKLKEIKEIVNDNNSGIKNNFKEILCSIIFLVIKIVKMKIKIVNIVVLHVN